ncbi:hypothetical protein PVAP13_5KG747700 [Panicum virgatum]|uniref:Uncharacterized protein n=1 Tax=Panicum virgatum TaxID=38727 RepID=A0A8T0T1D1_PANVG|nr:hypothetical protein PVAP13_5KG747700 [Panicum virgatum]
MTGAEPGSVVEGAICHLASLLILTSLYEHQERRQGVVKLHQQKYIFDQGICFMEAVVISCTLADVNYLEHLLVICSPSQANKNLDSFCRFVGSPSGKVAHHQTSLQAIFPHLAVGFDNPRHIGYG